MIWAHDPSRGYELRRVVCRLLSARMAIGGVLFDIDGVLVTSWQPIPGAAERCASLADHQIARTYLTNTTTRTREQIAELLTDAGMDVTADEVITAAVLTADYVRDRYPGRAVLPGQQWADRRGHARHRRRLLRRSPRQGARDPRRHPARRRRTGIRPRHAQPRLRLDGPGRARRGDAPQHVVEHHRGAAHRHRACT